MEKSNIEESVKLASVRQNIILHLAVIPDLIQVHGSNSLGSVSLALGKCLLWVGPTLDDYNLIQPLPGAAPVPRVADLGEQLRVVGLQIMHRPSTGELQHTVDVLKRQVATLTQLATIQAEGAR
jgi:hypothetical protein